MPLYLLLKYTHTQTHINKSQGNIYTDNDHNLCRGWFIKLNIDIGHNNMDVNMRISVDTNKQTHREYGRLYIFISFEKCLTPFGIWHS